MSELAVPRKGGVISPILSNLFLHYAFDLWMGRTHPDIPWCRYADDGLVHCRTEQEAEALNGRVFGLVWRSAGLEMHPTKTKIVYCRDSNRKGNVSERQVSTSSDTVSGPARIRKVSRTNASVLRLQSGGQPFGAESHALDDPGLEHPTTNAAVAGGHRTYSSTRSLGAGLNTTEDTRLRPLSPMLRYVNQTLVRWAMRKFKRFKAHKIRASRFLQKLVREKMSLFVHWRIGMTGTFA